MISILRVLQRLWRWLFRLPDLMFVREITTGPVEFTGPLHENPDVVVPLTATLRNRGGSTAEGQIRIAAFMKDGDKSVLISVGSNKLSVAESSLVQFLLVNDLEAGTERTLFGFARVPGTYRFRNVQLYLEADSTALDEFSYEYGRVAEFVETNNQSALVEVNLRPTH